MRNLKKRTSSASWYKITRAEYGRFAKNSKSGCFRSTLDWQKRETFAK